ncbi:MULTISPECIES: multicopper oxidase family protein [Haloferax]|uniref:Multicopper oxidase domain-containing protein n=2 Tax=Haloferax TaxID=2251 RepID=A0A6G1Z0P7_9EURY|nr:MULTISPECIES: multicopper oxidase domain-containing protein [Haloferax]KAB1187416.1 multicopper oxidase domain-containing protein [Haloferax sp. CBA1149]MRW80065.1 multicopper oxidase domain-containing protein [Haloferax marinisediminis]
MDNKTTQKQKDSAGKTGLSRRTVLKGAAAVGLFSTLPWSVRRARAQATQTPLDFTGHKWQDPLPRPGVMTPDSRKGGVDHYEISMTEFQQQVLPSTMGDKPTTLWGYGGTYPAATIEARPDRPVSVKWMNELGTDWQGNSRGGEHLLSVDKRVHGADHGAPEIRTVVHLHGGVAAEQDDGYSEAWVTPEGKTTDDFAAIPDSPVAYKQTKEYPNRQEPGTLWYHDHALGITRLNVYAGLAGFYLLRDPVENSLPSDEYEIPILLQDRSFTSGGELQYPDGTDDSFEAEFWGDVPVVNGKAYPCLEVEPRKYRFRFLNGSNGRTFNLKFYNEDSESYDDAPVMEQIGVDLGFLDDVVTVGPGGMVPSLLLSGAERADVVVDFSDFEGEEFILDNGTGIPYAGEDFVPRGDDSIDVDMREMLKIKVTKPLSEPDNSIPSDQFLKVIGKKIDRYDFTPEVTDTDITRTFSLDSATLEVEEGVEYDSHFLDLSLWSDEDAVVDPELNTSETWEFVNTTGDSHPIHLHLVDMEVLERESFTWNDGTGDTYAQHAQDYINAYAEYLENGGMKPEKPDVKSYITPDAVTPPTPNNTVKKDTVLVNPNEMLRVKVDFTGFAGRFAWHCHILEHEDQEMMLPFEVVE